ncbi:AlpA family phage regulatory protein [Erythrobacter arachoides]|uniref:AlpA family phage regulatory protein n=2 Tax=Aurantiacibacter arachoides TaxID=1850444 RepID=A0A844ZXF8_9SPHN|nr:AlpA family phage regulatory protein [Aurantiacibacter arachoides]
MVTEPKLRAARAVSRQAQLAVEPADQKTPSERSDLAGVGPPLISIEAVCEMTGMATSTIYKRIDDDGFPQQIKLGSRSLWDKEEVAAWLREKAALRGN